MRTRVLSAISILLLVAGIAVAQETVPQEPKGRDLMPPVMTRHQIAVADGRTIDYTATVGYMTLKNEKQEESGYFFYIAYVAENSEAAERPLTFCFNGGPGSSSIYLHMTAIGPRIVELDAEGMPLAPPSRMKDNPYTWLAFTDLVFVDPIGTGFSHPAPGQEGKQFWGVEEDAASVAEFMRQYITANARWLSPVFVAGESYGGVRGSLLAAVLREDTTIALNVNGLIFISPAYDLQQVFTRDYDTLSLALYLPTFATTAWYHRKLAAELQADFDALVSEAKTWTVQRYLPALVRGDSVPEEELRTLAAEMARLTGLPEDYLVRQKLRVTSQEFREKLLEEEEKSLDRLDARFENGSYNLQVALSPVMNHYLRQDLEYDTPEPYFSSAQMPFFDSWNWGNFPGAYTVVPVLAQAMRDNPSMQVFVAAGYYDFAVPYLVIEHCLDQLLLSPELRENIALINYRAGHMVYTPQAELERFTADVRTFVEGAANTSR